MLDDRSLPTNYPKAVLSDLEGDEEFFVGLCQSRSPFKNLIFRRDVQWMARKRSDVSPRWKASGRLEAAESLFGDHPMCDRCELIKRHARFSPHLQSLAQIVHRGNPFGIFFP